MTGNGGNAGTGDGGTLGEGYGFFAPLRMTGGGGGPVAHTVRRYDITNSQKGPSGKPDGPNFAMNDSVN